jgi:uncharacterized protein (UPF0264 family)
VAKSSDVDVIMVDTAIKDGKSTFEFMSEQELSLFISASQKLGLEVAIAGTIGFQDMDLLKRLKPDIIGVRGIVCGGDRKSSIKSELVTKLKLAISEA